MKMMTSPEAEGGFCCGGSDPTCRPIHPLTHIAKKNNPAPPLVAGNRSAAVLAEIGGKRGVRGEGGGGEGVRRGESCGVNATHLRPVRQRWQTEIT